MTSIGLRVLFFLLFNFSQIWRASAAPQGTQGGTVTPVGSQNKPLMGVGITADGLRNPKYAEVVKKYFQVLTPGNEMKWESLEGNPGQFNFGPATQIYEFAKKHNKFLRIHTMFAKSQNPKWIDQLQKQDLQNAMARILEKVISQYSDRSIGMDVCNEILNDQGNLDDNPWKRILGDSWVDMAFTMAKRIRDKYNKNMLLFINDFSIEGRNPKSDGMLKLATRLNKAGILDGVGFQGHFIVGQVPKDFKQNLERFTAAGLKVAITEVDVRSQLNGQKTASPQDQETKIKDYKMIYETCRQVKGCVSVTAWGLTPSDSWIGKYGFFPGFGDATLFNDNFTPNKALRNLQGNFFPKGG